MISPEYDSWKSEYGLLRCLKSTSMNFWSMGF
jgi:hypothetical protein